LRSTDRDQIRDRGQQFHAMSYWRGDFSVKGTKLHVDDEKCVPRLHGLMVLLIADRYALATSKPRR
jgi:hypothetical protein